MKRFLVLGAVLLGLSGCVSDYPGYDPYPGVYDTRPVPIYRDRYQPAYRDYPSYRNDPRYRDAPGYGNYRPPSRPPIRPDYRGPERPTQRLVEARPRVDPRRSAPPAYHADRPTRIGERPGVNLTRPPVGRPGVAPGPRGPRPYIPPVQLN